jgi:hypothetical protein
LRAKGALSRKLRPEEEISDDEPTKHPEALDTGGHIEAQGFGHRPTPWVTGDRSTPRPEGPREVLFETAPLLVKAPAALQAAQDRGGRWVPGNRPAASSLGSEVVDEENEPPSDDLRPHFAHSGYCEGDAAGVPW